MTPPRNKAGAMSKTPWTTRRYVPSPTDTSDAIHSIAFVKRGTEWHIFLCETQRPAKTHPLFLSHVPLWRQAAPKFCNWRGTENKWSSHYEGPNKCSYMPGGKFATSVCIGCDVQLRPIAMKKHQAVFFRKTSRHSHVLCYTPKL